LNKQLHLRVDADCGYRSMVGVGGIGSGIFFALEGGHTLGRDESRPGRLLDIRDYCKLHIISHYVAKLLGAAPGGDFHVVPVGKVGDDAPGRQMIREMNTAGMETNYVATVAGAPTLFSVCFQYPDGTGGNITTSDSAAAQLSCEDLDKLEHLFSGPTVALAAPEVPLTTRAHFLKMAGKHGVLRAASFTAAEIAPVIELGMFADLDLVSLNAGEAAVLAGRALDAGDPLPFLQACENILKSDYPQLRFVLTAGSMGAFAYWQGAWDFCPAPKVQVASTAGAGDALLAGLIAATVAGIPLIHSQPSLAAEERPLASALDFAVLLASYTVTSPHTIHPQADVNTLLAFAADLGLSFAPTISQSLEQASESTPVAQGWQL
jgi:sugar/nucleoside kinase (ribokinase family)